jgi:hypothetical protein
MIRRLVLFAALCLMTGCQRPAQFAAPGISSEGASPVKRYIAVRRQIEIETAESELQNAWESIGAFCGTIRCEIVSSSIVNRTSGTAPSGSISMRVAPADMKKLLDQLGKSGTLIQQTNESQDKTATVIDVDAKIKNLTEYRDNLRGLLGRSSANLTDLIAVRKELTDVQSQLDSQATQRKVLADETEKVAIDIHFRVKGSGSGFGKIGTAFSDSMSVMADSVAVLITFVFAIVPWVLLLLIAAWIAVKAIRRRRKA